jgi:3'(2'), 5'-bisphosphate nucleotidase
VFCESVESAHSSHDDHAAIAEKLGITRPSVRMDSQAKYASIAQGTADIYLRLPRHKGYEEKIWDHAAGDLLVRESGGQVSDVEGKRIDFSRGRTLQRNTGIVAAPLAIHDTVVDAVKRVIQSKT